MSDDNSSSFDYGAEPVEAGGTFKQAEVGPHEARLRSLIHLGMFRELFQGKQKSPAPEVVAVFELKGEEDFEDDGTTPLFITKAFPVKKGDRTFMTKFLKALDPKGAANGFDELIDTPCMVEVVPSKKVNDDGTPKYVNFGGVTGMTKKFAAMVEPLTEGGAGHVRFDDLTEDAIMELNPILEVANILLKGENYAGSKAEGIVAAIRKENPEFAKMSEKTEDQKKQDEEADSQAQEEVKTDMDENQNY